MSEITITPPGPQVAGKPFNLTAAVTPALAGTYTFQVLDQTTGVSATTTVTVTNPAPLLPGPPTFSLVSVSGSAAIFTLDLPTTGAPIDAGKIIVQYQRTPAATWATVKTIPYTTPGKGPITNQFGVWTITPAGVIELNGTASPSANVTLLIDEGTNVAQENVAGDWYTIDPPAGWQGPFINPLHTIAVPGLTGQYSFRAFVSTIAGNGTASPVVNVAILSDAPPVFSATFGNGLSLHDTWQPGDPFALVATDTPQGRWEGQGTGQQWWANPFNPETPIQGLYGASQGNMTLGLLPTPATMSAAAANQPFMGCLLNTSATCFHQFGYWEFTAAVPAIPGFVFQFDLESPDNGWPPEIDVWIGNNADGTQQVWFNVALGGPPDYPTFEWSMDLIPPGLMQTYGIEWTAAGDVNFYINRVQETGMNLGGNTLYNVPCYAFIVTGANYTNYNGTQSPMEPGITPDPTKLAGAQVQFGSLKYWTERPF